MGAIVDPGKLVVSARTPLIKVVKTIKWRRDPGITELIEYLDQPERRDNWGALSKAEFSEIVKITDRCRKDFAYAARNFFWITTKDRVDRLFSLWESQELILEHILRLKARGLVQKLQIIKARQLGCSTLLEGLIAWKSMFFRNVNALVVSYDRSHAAYLFGIMQHIYDMMPWWLQPACSSREYKDGLRFDNPTYKDRRDDPGLQSQVTVEAANKMSGVGQGLRISAAHISEYADYEEFRCKAIIEADLGGAIAENSESFAVLESTAKGAGTYAHRLWNKNVELAEKAEWYPLFLPWFFETTRVRPPDGGWRPDQTDLDMQARIQSEWVRCDNGDCLQYHERRMRGENRSESSCPTCNAGTLHAYALTPEQLCWMHYKRKNAAKDEESLQQLAQEMASTAEEAFQLSGFKLFSNEIQGFVNNCVRPPLVEGFLDASGRFHGNFGQNPKVTERDGRFWHKCYAWSKEGAGCEEDHSSGDTRGEHPLKIWEFPMEGCEYVIGADVAEGLGAEADYSVGVILKVSRTGGQDQVVAVFRSNTTDPIAFAYQLNWLGRWYNEAMLAIELNKYDTTASWVRFQMQYPNLYRWKNMDSINPLSSKLGWVTQQNSKPRLWQTANKYLKDRILINPSRNFAEEIKTFRKEDADDRSGGAGDGFYDDEAMATFIALYTAHEGDWDEQLGQIRTQGLLNMENAPWIMKCGNLACEYTWAAKSPTEWPVSNPTMKNRCPKCGSRLVGGTRNITALNAQAEPDALTGVLNADYYEEQRQRMLDRWGITAEQVNEQPDYEVI